MKWKIPPKIKIYEALGCIGDNRIEVKGNSAKVFSSSRNKYYGVEYEPENNAIISNDNGSYWIGYLGYPSIAFLMLRGVLKYDFKYAEALKGISWKDINVRFKNDFEKTEEYVDSFLEENGISLSEFKKEIDNIYKQIEKLNINKLARKIIPPEGY